MIFIQKFRTGNFDLFNAARSGRLVTLANDDLRAVVETYPCQTIE